MGHQAPQSPLQGPGFSVATQWTWTATMVAWGVQQGLHPAWHFPGQHSHLLPSAFLFILHHPSREHSSCKASASCVFTCGHPRPSPLYLLHSGEGTFPHTTSQQISYCLGLPNILFLACQPLPPFFGSASLGPKFFKGLSVLLQLPWPGRQ